MTSAIYIKTAPGRDFFGHLTSWQCSDIRREIKPTFGNSMAFSRVLKEQAGKYGLHRRYILRAVASLTALPTDG